MKTILKQVEIKIKYNISFSNENHVFHGIRLWN